MRAAAGRFAPSPTRAAAPRQPSHGAARVVLRALARRAVSCCGSRISIRSARGREHEAAALADLRAARHRLGRRAGAPERAPRPPPRSVRTRCASAGCSTAAGARAPRSARPRRLRTAAAGGRAPPRASTRAPAASLSAERARGAARRSGRRARGASTPRGARIVVRGRGSPGRRRRPSTTSCVWRGDAGARPGPGLQPRGRRRRRRCGHRRGRPRRRPARDDAAADAAGAAARPAGPAATHTCRWCSTPTGAGSPSAPARSRWASASRSASASRTVVGWMASSVGLAPRLRTERRRAARNLRPGAAAARADALARARRRAAAAGATVTVVIAHGRAAAGSRCSHAALRRYSSSTRSGRSIPGSSGLTAASPWVSATQWESIR